MEKVSVIILSKNSAETIEKAIRSVNNIASEIIVVDGGSRDETKKIVDDNGAKFVTAEFRNFADQRNFALTFCSSKWVFYLDSDEEITDKFASELSDQIKTAGEEISGFWIRRKTYYFGKDWGFIDRVQRVFLKHKLKRWHGVVHETPEVEGRLGTIDSPISHYTHRNLEQMVEKTNEWSEFEADLRLRSHHPRMDVFRFVRVMATGFFDSYFRGGGWKNGTAGIVESIFQAFSMFITYAKLWEKQRKG